MVEASHVKMFAHAAVMSALFLLLNGSARGAEAQPAAPVPFPVASAHMEQNVTDGDMEVVFEVKGGDDGLAELSVVSPDGRPVVTFRAPDSSTLGIRQFRFESPEPRDVKALRAAYPEGVYEFSGKTFSGATLAGKSTLSHRWAAATKFVRPAPAAENVSVKDLTVSWSAVPGIASYLVSIEQRELKVSITASLPGSSTSFVVPHGFLVRGRKYKMAIGTVTPEGNISFAETTFTTER
jgi:hypothetical protein